MTAYTTAYDVATSPTSNLRKQVSIAIQRAALDVLAEPANTPNRAARLGWANRVTRDQEALALEAGRMVYTVLTNGPIFTAVSGGGDATDAQVQAVVAAAVNAYAERGG